MAAKHRNIHYNQHYCVILILINQRPIPNCDCRFFYTYPEVDKYKYESKFNGALKIKQMAV